MLNVHWFRYPAILLSFVGLVLWFIAYFNKVAPEVEWWVSALVVIFSVVLAAVVALVPDLANIVAQFLGDRFAAIMLPDERFDKPPLSYLLAHRFVKQGRLEEAVEEYLIIIKYYPDELNAYRELIDVAERLNDKKLSNKMKLRLHKRMQRLGHRTL